jgi:tRNA nucleotidyltransferase (CCA-adding enzyme)
MAQSFRTLRALRTQASEDSPLCTESIDLLYWGILIAQLPAQSHATLTQRLGLRSETQQLMRGLAHLHTHLDELTSPNLPPSRVVALLDPLNPVALALIPAIYPDVYPSNAQLLFYTDHYQQHWQHVHPKIGGHDLATLGVPRGPIYSEILAALRAAKLDGILLTRAEEEAFVHSYLQKLE